MEDKIMRHNIHNKFSNKYLTPFDIYETNIIEIYKNVYGAEPKKVPKQVRIYNTIWLNYRDEYVNNATEYFTRLAVYKKDKQLLQDCINITNQQKEFENNKNMHSNTLNDKEERLLYQYLFNMNTK